jgi:beta-galactosidase
MCAYGTRDMVDQGLLLEGSTPDKPLFGFGGDFGDLPNTKQFCINGILGPDRRAHPTALEAAAVQAPVAVELLTDDKQETLFVSVENRYEHSTLAAVSVKVTLRSNLHDKLSSSRASVNVSGGSEGGGGGGPETFIECQSLAAGESCAYLLSELFPLFDLSVSKVTDEDVVYAVARLLGIAPCVLSQSRLDEVWIDVVVTSTQAASEWVPAGHTIVHKTLSTPRLAKFVNELLSGSVERLKFSVGSSSIGGAGQVSHVETETAVVVTWTSSGSSATLSKSTGRLEQWKGPGGSIILAEPIDICLWRAPTDNDRGGSFLAYYTRWNAVGLRYFVLQSGSVTVEYCNATPNGQLVVEMSWTLVNGPDHGEPPVIKAKIPCMASYTFYPDGSIQVLTTVSPPSSLPALPRVGISFALSSSYKQTEWYGLGPHEAYDDRQECVYLDKFASSVADLHVPYVFPQENGRRAAPRYTRTIRSFFSPLVFKCDRYM